MATAAKKTKATDLPECPYGARCYRKNPNHFLEFSHPKKAKPSDSDNDSSDNDAPGPSTVSKVKLPTTDDSSLPPCKYGANCYRKNLMHFAEFSHPTKVVDSVTADDSGDDTDVMSDADDNAGDTADGKDVKSTDILKRGISLVKSYSKMSEDERKELIKRALEAKKQLQDELEKTKQEVKLKAEQVEKLQKEITTGMLLMDGEKEALKGKVTKFFELWPERGYKEGSAAQIHYRLAESQFHRLLSGTYMGNYRLTKVEYVVNPELVEHFRQCREDLKKTRGEEYSLPVLAFHGTEIKNIIPICETGFLIPGSKGHTHRTDTGYYGKGVYFSEYPAYSMGYIHGAQKFLLCQVLQGKVYNCSKLIHGAPLKKGFDSHTSPDKKELVIFNKYHILPSYIVHYESSNKEFKYKEPKKKKPGDMFNEKVVAKQYAAACKKKPLPVFNGLKIKIQGIFKRSHGQMTELIENNFGKKVTGKSHCNILVVSKEEFEGKTKTVTDALSSGTTVVPELFLYDNIVNFIGKCNTEDYSLK